MGIGGQKEDKSYKRKSQGVEIQLLAILGGDPGGARTHDPMIKSHLLYQLSHGVILLHHRS